MAGEGDLISPPALATASFESDIVPLLSSLIGYCILCASVMLKVPQIVSILRHRSAAGVSLTTYLIDTFVFGVNASWGIAFGLPISTYGENVVILVQIVIVALLVGYFQGTLLRVAAPCVGGMLLLNGMLAMRMLPVWIHEVLFSGHIFIGILAKLPQIRLTHTKKATGTLSFATNFLRFGGSCVRVLTSLISVSWEQGKLVLALSYVASSFFNGVIVGQFFLYGHQKVFITFRRHTRRLLRLKKTDDDDEMHLPH